MEDTTHSTSADIIQVSKSGTTYSCTYKPVTLEPGSYTVNIVYRNFANNSTSNEAVYSFTVAAETPSTPDPTPTTPATPSTPTDTAGALEDAASSVTSSTSVTELQETILDTVTVSGSSNATAEEKVEALASTMQSGSSEGEAIVAQVEKLEEAVKDAKGLTVKAENSNATDVSISSVVGLALNEASSNQITITAGAVSVARTAPSSATASEPFSLTVRGLVDSSKLGFPVQIAVTLPSHFNTSGAVYVRHYTGSGSSYETLPARIVSKTVVFTVTGFSDFLLYQESSSSSGSSGSSGGSGGGGGSSSAATTYGNVTLNEMSHGSVSVSPKAPTFNQTVTLTVRPNTGYDLDSITVTDKNGNSVELTKVSDTQYTFVMPAGKATVDAEFVSNGQSTGIVVPSYKTFSDVPASHTFYTEISWASEKGIMSGYATGLFNPGFTVTRQQLWMVLGRIAGANPADMAAARTWAVNSGVSDGSSATGAMSRQQLVTMLYRYAVSKGLATAPSQSLSAYPDSGSVASYAAEALSWAVQNGIVGGTSDGRLNPEGTATRGQFAAILYRFASKTGAI